MPTDTKSELAAILTGTAIFPITDRAFLRISGADATRWLNGMVTNSIQSLAPGEGNYNFLLNAQGRIQGDCTIYREPGEETTFLLETDATQLDTIHQLLDKFIIMDDVELTRIGQDEDSLLLIGPKAAVTIESFASPVPEALKMVSIGIGPLGTILLTTPPARSVQEFQLRGPAAAIGVVHSEAIAQQAVHISAETLEAFRILSGTPRYGQDIRNNETARDLPQETGQTHALHFTKGCYLGQEIVERIHSRGQVHRTFSGFRLSALPTALPMPLTASGKTIGELTSAAILPLPEGDIPFALGYIRREALTQTLNFEGATATPTSLPFRPS